MEYNKKVKIFGIIAIVFFILFLIAFVLIFWWQDYNNRTSDIINFIIGYLFNIGFFIGIPVMIISTILAVYYNSKYKKKTKPIDNAISVLYERYALGEITKEELDKMKKDIER